MAASAVALAAPQAEAEAPTVDAASPVTWPLTYKLQVPPGTAMHAGSVVDDRGKSNQGRRNAGPQTWWHFYRYRNPQGQKPQVLYSSTREESERIAKLFLHEKVIGFDMEWPWDADKKSRLQDKVGLIQLASESTIALIHIGLHAGATPDELIAPTLKAVIESPRITKVGVGIMNADYSRLVKHFRLRPRAGFELSHLHFLTLYGHSEADKITTKLCGLAKQVEFHLGLPLWKGKARTSDWSRKLDEQQVNYAADDAYAGLMLYHCMNAKRLAMAIVPRLPVHGDMYSDALFPLRSQGIRPIWLVPESEDGLIQTAAAFFKAAMIERGLLPAPPKETVDDIAVAGYVGEWGAPDQQHQDLEDRGKEACRQADRPGAESAAERSNQPDAGGPPGPFSMELYRELASQRLQQCRIEGCKPYMIASNKTLEELARHRPTTKEDLLKIKGIGPRKAKMYGDEWLSIIKDFIEDEKEQLEEQPGHQQEELHAECPQLEEEEHRQPRHHEPEPVTPAPANTRRVGRSLEILGSPPMMHTGLSFTMAEASIGEEANNNSHKHGGHDESDSEGSAFGSPMPSPSADRIKRRRCSEDTPTSPKVPGSRGPHEAESTRSMADAVGTTSRAPLLQPLAESPNSPSSAATPSAPAMPLHLHIYRQKLVAFSKMVASRLPPERRPPDGRLMVQDGALDRLVAAQPATRQDLWAIPGIAPLVRACDFVEMDLLAVVAKWKPKEAAGTGPG